MIDFTNINRYLLSFINKAVEIVSGDYKYSEEELIRYLCPIGKSLLKTLILFAELLPNFKEESTIISSAIKDTIVKSSLPLFDKLKVKAIFKDNYLFVRCVIEQSTSPTPIYVEDLPEEYEEQKMQTICKYLKDWGLEKYIEGCENNGDNVKEKDIPKEFSKAKLGADKNRGR